MKSPIYFAHFLYVENHIAKHHRLTLTSKTGCKKTSLMTRGGSSQQMTPNINRHITNDSNKQKTQSQNEPNRKKI